MLKKHTYLIVSGTEMTIVGCYFAIVQTHMRDDPRSPLVHVLFQLGSPYWASVLMVVGMLAVIVGMLDLHRWHLVNIALCVSAGMWLAYGMAFLSQSSDFKYLDLNTIFFMFNFIMTVTEAWGTGGR